MAGRRRGGCEPELRPPTRPPILPPGRDPPRPAAPHWIPSAAFIVPRRRHRLDPARLRHLRRRWTGRPCRPDLRLHRSAPRQETLESQSVAYFTSVWQDRTRAGDAAAQAAVSLGHSPEKTATHLVLAIGAAQAIMHLREQPTDNPEHDDRCGQR